MTGAAVPVPTSSPYIGAEIQRVWPDHGRAMPSRSLSLAAIAGLAAATVLPSAAVGLGLFVVGVLVAAAALPTALPRIGVHEIGYGVLATLLLSVVVLRDAEWLVALCLLGTVAAASYALIGGRTTVGVVLAAMSLPMAGLRALPWIGRGVRARLDGRWGTWGPSLRTLTTSVVLLVVFGALFASADAVFASLLPSIDLADVPLRVLVFIVFTGLALSAAFLGAAPPRWDVLAPRPARPVGAFEWIAPIGGVVAMFAVFVAVQVSVLLGGDDYVLRTAGLTYAEHARSGFGQLVVVTLLTLAVVAAAGRWAPRDTPGQRLVLRLLLGALCLLALAVVVFALNRLHLYEDAFGFTRLRLFMNVFEGWLGLLLVLVLLAGVRLRAPWLPGAIVVTAAAALLGLAAVNPDGFVADRNVDRFTATGKLDVAYLRVLSADAVPAIDRLPEPARSCALAGIRRADDGWAGWNLGRAQAEDILAARSASVTSECADVTLGG
jgi:two-component system sensor histidine kinase BaeS